MSNDNVIEGQFTELDRLDLAKLGGEGGGELPNYHTILEVWRELLKPAAAEAAKKVTPQWAHTIVTRFPGIEFKDMNEFRDAYFGKLEEMRQILLEEISTDEDCLTYDSPEEDAVENRQHYKALLHKWQEAILRWELEWDCTYQYAAVEMAAISETHKMFFGETGLTAFLDNIKFEFTEADQQELADLLNAQREEAQ